VGKRRVILRLVGEDVYDGAYSNVAFNVDYKTKEKKIRSNFSVRPVVTTRGGAKSITRS